LLNHKHDEWSQDIGSHETSQKRLDGSIRLPLAKEVLTMGENYSSLKDYLIYRISDSYADLISTRPDTGQDILHGEFRRLPKKIKTKRVDYSYK
jgi:hypothetical protein